MKWPCVELGTVTTVVSGFGFPREFQEIQSEEIPFFKVDDMNHPMNTREMIKAANYISPRILDKLQARVFPKGTIIFPKIGAAIATGKKRILFKDSTFDNNIMGLIPSNAVDSKFLYYWTLTFNFTTISNIGPVPSLRKSTVEKIQIPLPPLSEQRRIVEILDQADALRKKRAEADEKAKRILPALFYKMFGDPATNPRGWPIKTLGELSLNRPQYGANARAIDYQDGLPRYVRITDITADGKLSNTDIKTIDTEDWESYRLIDGDLLFARSGATVGKTYIYTPEDGLCVFAGYLIRFQVNRDKIEPWVVFEYTQTSHYQAWVNSKRRTAAQPNINGQEYASLKLIIPDKKLQCRFVNAAKSIRKLYMQHEASLKKLESLFSNMLHGAFSGDLTAKWREAHVNELLGEMEEQTKALGIGETGQSRLFES